MNISVYTLDKNIKGFQEIAQALMRSKGHRAAFGDFMKMLCFLTIQLLNGPKQEHSIKCIA